MVSEIEIRIEHHSEVPDTLCWRDLISQNIDREVREELVTPFLGAYDNELGFFGLSFNLFANMKF